MARDKLSIASVNARGLNNTQKRISFFNWIRENSIDIVMVQETFCTREFILKFNYHWKGAIIIHLQIQNMLEVFVLY